MLLYFAKILEFKILFYSHKVNALKVIICLITSVRI